MEKKNGNSNVPATLTIKYNKASGFMNQTSKTFINVNFLIYIFNKCITIETNGNHVRLVKINILGIVA